MFGSSIFEVLAAIVFGAALLAACVSDLRWRRISNLLVVVTALSGVTYSIGHVGQLEAGAPSLGGVAIGLVLWLPCYWLGMMGAGDVKFFAAAAAWLGPEQTLYAAVVSALFGGILAVGWLLGSRVLRENFESRDVKLEPTDGSGAMRCSGVAYGRTLPYGVAMAAGLALVAWFPNILR